MKCEEYLCTSANLFGFEKAHGTELCIYVADAVSKPVPITDVV